jgi:hypothetical protein
LAACTSSNAVKTVLNGVQANQILWNVTAQGTTVSFFATEGEPPEGGAPSVRRAAAPRWFSPDWSITEGIGQKLA